MLFSAVARTIHRVGHKVLKPGASCSRNASNAESHFGEYFINNLDISKQVSSASLKSLIVSPTAKFNAWP